jgi:hypothetical protein
MCLCCRKTNDPRALIDMAEPMKLKNDVINMNIKRLCFRLQGYNINPPSTRKVGTLFHARYFDGFPAAIPTAPTR